MSPEYKSANDRQIKWRTSHLSKADIRKSTQTREIVCTPTHTATMSALRWRLSAPCYAYWRVLRNQSTTPGTTTPMRGHG